VVISLLLYPDKQGLRGIVELDGGRSCGRSVGRAVRCRFSVREITQNVQETSTSNFVGRYITLCQIAVQKNHNNNQVGVVALYLFYTLNFVRDITLKRQGVLTRNFLER
jgi:hypothetical protein